MAIKWFHLIFRHPNHIKLVMYLSIKPLYIYRLTINDFPLFFRFQTHTAQLYIYVTKAHTSRRKTAQVQNRGFNGPLFMMRSPLVICYTFWTGSHDWSRCFAYRKWWFSIFMLVYQMVFMLVGDYYWSFCVEVEPQTAGSLLVQAVPQIVCPNLGLSMDKHEQMWWFFIGGRCGWGCPMGEIFGNILWWKDDLKRNLHGTLLLPCDIWWRMGKFAWENPPWMRWGRVHPWHLSPGRNLDQEP